MSSRTASSEKQSSAEVLALVWAMSFFWLRVAHAIVYLLTIPYIRTLVFALGFVAVAGIFWEVVR